MRGKPLGDDPRRAFLDLHGFVPAAPTPIKFRLPRKYLVDLYEVTRVEGDRWVDMGTGPRAQRFYHDFAPGHGPTIATDADGIGYLIDGRYHVTTHGIEDTDMAHYMVRNRHGRFVPVHHYRQHHGMHHYGHRNPWSPMVSGLLLVGGGLLGGLVVNAAVQALPASVGDTIKDGVSLGLAALAVYIPHSGGGRLFGISAAAILAGGVINRRTDVTNRIVGWVHTKFAALYDRAGGSTTQATRSTEGLPMGTDRYGLPTMEFGAAPSESYAGAMS